MTDAYLCPVCPGSDHLTCQPSPTLLPSYLWTSPPIGQLGSLLACDWLSHYWAQATISSVRHRPAFIPSRVIDPVCEDPCESVASAYKNRSQPSRQKAGRIHGILDTQILSIGTIRTHETASESSDSSSVTLLLVIMTANIYLFR